jgi:dolichyl-phosphate-mannose--protein O-mannosyl transferase
VPVSSAVAEARPERVDTPSGSSAPVWRARLQELSGSDRFWGWAAPLLVTLIGGVQRFLHLDLPHKLIFDETYYVKEGVSYLRFGVEMGLRQSLTADDKKRNDVADKLFTSGNLDVYSNQPDRVVHPPVGKWMIAAGEWLFGPTSSWGWRFSAALVGTLSLLMIARIARRLLGSTLLGTTAGLLLAVDGQEFVHSRTGILDIFVMFWALAAFGCLVIDRDAARARLQRLVAAGADPPSADVSPAGPRPTVASGHRAGPWLGMRWWRIAAVVCLALCTGVKWSGMYFAAAFLLMSFLWDLSARRAAGVRWWLLGGLLDGVQAFVTSVVLLPTVYVATWTGWFITPNGWNRQWAVEHQAQAGWAWVPDALRSLWHYHAETWAFHLALTSPHDWQANPWTWLIQGRPTLFFFDTYTNGHHGCHVATCRQAITDLGNPVIWWAATLGVGVLLFRWALARDWRAGAILAGLVGGYLPWFMYQQRTIFQFYAVAFVPWVVLIVTYCLGLVLGLPGVQETRRRVGALVAGSYVFVAVLVFWFFYPVLAARVIPAPSVELRHLVTSWF